MNQDTFEGRWKQVRGKAKEWWGQLTDDELDRVAGKKDQLVGAPSRRSTVTRRSRPSRRSIGAWTRRPDGRDAAAWPSPAPRCSQRCWATARSPSSRA
jgi:hypothetical protein